MTITILHALALITIAAPTGVMAANNNWMRDIVGNSRHRF